MNASGTSSSLKRTVATVLIAAGLAWLLFVVVKELVIYGLYFDYIDALAEKTNLNAYVINILAAIGLIPFLQGCKDCFSLSSNKRERGAALLFGMTILYNGILYIATRNDILGKYYAVDAVDAGGKALIAEKPRNDGNDWRQVTRENQWYVRKLGVGKPTDPNRDWFDQKTGLPLLWYYGNPSVARFYDGPGYDRENGEPLMAVTGEFRKKYDEVKRGTAAETESNERSGSLGGQLEADLEREKKKLPEEVALEIIAGCEREYRLHLGNGSATQEDAYLSRRTTKYGISIATHERSAASLRYDLRTVTGEEGYAWELYSKTGLIHWLDAPERADCIKRAVVVARSQQRHMPQAWVRQIPDGERSVAAARPSFDCAGAKTPVERTICSNAELAEADQRMASAYRSKLASLSGTALTDFKVSHRKWLSDYSAACNAVAAIESRTACIQQSLSSYTKHLAQIDY